MARLIHINWSELIIPCTSLFGVSSFILFSLVKNENIFPILNWFYFTIYIWITDFSSFPRLPDCNQNWVANWARRWDKKYPNSKTTAEYETKKKSGAFKWKRSLDSHLTTLNFKWHSTYQICNENRCPIFADSLDEYQEFTTLICNLSNVNVVKVHLLYA